MGLIKESADEILHPVSNINCRGQLKLHSTANKEFTKIIRPAANCNAIILGVKADHPDEQYVDKETYEFAIKVFHECDELGVSTDFCYRLEMEVKP
ncbi:hypothetical protein KIL84_001749, partial [Mauremys mutica]